MSKIMHIPRITYTLLQLPVADIEIFFGQLLLHQEVLRALQQLCSLLSERRILDVADRTHLLHQLRGGIADLGQELIILIFMLLQISQRLLTGRIPPSFALSTKIHN